MKTYNEFKKDILKDPKVGAVYNSLEPAYRIAKALIEARLEKNLTQEELAKKAGVTLNTITRLESGTANPTIRTVSHVAAVLDKELKLATTS